MDSDLTLRVDGVEHRLTVDTRTSLLDALRQRLGVQSAKKGCDHGQCGSCTVLVDGTRVLACLTLAVTRDGSEVLTAAGLDGDAGGDVGGHTATDGHPVHRAFVDHDGFQCGYCTPGQVCSAVGVLDEVARGWPSAVTDDLAGDPELDEAEIAERMSGNLCRCGAYVGIRAAVAQAAREQGVAR